MSLTRFCFASLLFLACRDAIAQDDEALIDDLPRARKEAAQVTPKPRKKPLSRDGNAPHTPQLNSDLIDDLSPEQKRAAAERSDEHRIENAIPDTLAEALARAMHHSPAVLVADAKVRQAQAELHEARQSVVHDLTLAFKRRELSVATDRHDPQAAAEFLEDEARIIYLLGVAIESPAGMYLKPPRPTNGPGSMPPNLSGLGGMPAMGIMPDSMMGDDPHMGRMPGGPMPAAIGHTADSKAPSDMPENVRSFLNKRIDLDFTKQPLQDVLDYIKVTGDSGVDFVLQNPDVTAPDSLGPPVTIFVKQVTVAAALQALADLNGCAFIFRDYGILVISSNDNGRSRESYRASGARMIAPPQQSGLGGMMMGPMGPGMGGHMMGGPGHQ